MQHRTALLKVDGRASSINVRKVVRTCDEPGIGYEREDCGAGLRSLREAEFFALNPKALTPVVIEGDTVLPQSNAICRYLAAKHGSDLLPADPARRAEVETWMDWMISGLNMA
ncbi:MAG: glutathione S-transferase N-terminal domain-containing protein [Hyphomonas sp.]|uniref:glutathione S-transferase N-terminal domain-containing protein n=1 Tax=Hyphomonas sp. TaxID=87 RepID=UPI0034A09602